MDLLEPIEVLGVKVTINPIKFKDNLQLQILFELREKLSENLDVRFVYVHSPTNKECDEELKVYEIPANRIGKFKVNFLVAPPILYLEKLVDVFGITLLLIQFTYITREFMRIGYYVNNELYGPVERDSKSNLFFKMNFSERNILEKQPRITKFSQRFN